MSRMMFGLSALIWHRICLGGHSRCSIFQDVTPIQGTETVEVGSKFATTAARRTHQAETAAIIQGWTAQRSKAEVVSTLAAGGVPAAAVNNVAEMVTDPQGQGQGVVGGR